jgi:hypothetical protein
MLALTGERFRFTRLHQAGNRDLAVDDCAHPARRLRAHLDPKAAAGGGDGRYRVRRPFDAGSRLGRRDLLWLFILRRVTVYADEPDQQRHCDERVAPPLTEVQEVGSKRTPRNSLFDHFGTEGIDIDPADFADIFTLNASLIPIDPRDHSNVTQQARASVRAGTHQLALERRSIGGAYHSLGYTSLQRDVRGFRIRDSFTLLRDALVVSAAYEQDHDNLDDSRPASTKNSGGVML